MTLSGVFLSVLSGTKMNGSAARQSIAHEPDSPDRAALRRCEIYRKSFPMTEIALPAHALRNLTVAKWCEISTWRSMCERARSWRPRSRQVSIRRG